MSDLRLVSRRDFLRRTGLAGGVLIVGVTASRLPLVLGALADSDESELFEPNVFVAIDRTGQVTVWVSRSDMGQGTRTGMPMIVAEELEVDVDRIAIVQADGDAKYGHQLTGGSLSVRLMYDPLRRAGATARIMLTNAAAQIWKVDRGECYAEHAEVIHRPSGRRLPYGDLVEVASRLEVPDEDSLELKSPEDYRLLGTNVGRRDNPDIVHGRARYGLDTRRPHMRYVAVARCPIYGGSTGGYDPDRALAIDGVEGVVDFDGFDGQPYVASGVAVIARHSWAALQGAAALTVSWNEGENAQGSTGALRQQFDELAARPGKILREDGDIDRAFASASETVEATYELPFLAHAPMEPMNCTVEVKGRSCEIWSPTQNPQDVRNAVAKALGFDPANVTVHVTLIGGGFGRRLYEDMEIEAALIARQVAGPIQVIWTREDDIQHDLYRPSSHHVLRGALDSAGNPIAWHWHILNTYPGRFVREDFPAYNIAHYRVEYSHVRWFLPRGAWRSTVYSQNPFVIQSFLDELAARGGRDPLDLRLQLLRDRPRPDGGDEHYDNGRMLAVLELAAERAGWGSSLPEGSGRGVAFQFCYGSYIAQIAQIRMVGSRPRIEKVTSAVDCGQLINPDLVRAQIEGGICFGLSAALGQEITVEGGRVRQGNFDDYPMLTANEMPQVETHLVLNHERPGGIGEVPIPPSAPAVTNALFAATGRRIRRLPLRLDSLG